MKIGAFEATLTDARVGDTTVALWRVAELARHVDRAALLAADEAPEPPYWAHLWRACRSPSSWSRSPPAARVRGRALRDLRRRDPHRQGAGQGGPASPRGDRRRGGLRAHTRADGRAQPHRIGL